LQNLFSQLYFLYEHKKITFSAGNHCALTGVSILLSALCNPLFMLIYLPMSIISDLFSISKKQVAKYRKIVDKINELEPSIQALSDIELKAKTLEFKDLLDKGATLQAILPEAFAVVREASHRTLGQRHYDVQLIGGMILHDGNIAEMKTGEGKTLMATLAVYLNAVSGKGVHIVTVNDYLARRDATWMGQIYYALGLSTGVVNEGESYIYDPSVVLEAEGLDEEEKLEKKEDEVGAFKIVYELLRPSDKKSAYNSDITYGTNNQFGFDYLRDNLEQRAEDLRQREFNYAIVDEVDSILIDESRTPLIIASPTVESGNLYVTFAELSNHLEKDIHYIVDEKFKNISVTDAGIDAAEKSLGVSNIYSEGGVKYVHHMETAIRAKALYHKDIDYIVKDNEVMIVDPSTGRLQPGRRWSEGLHQAIEAKEGVEIKKESRTFASITFQNYFRMYPKLAGMTGTGLTSQEEFLKVYGLDVIEVPTHRPTTRVDKTDLIFRTEAAKFRAIAKKIKELNQTGQPVLVGTVSIEKNQLLSEFLKKEGVAHTLLNAKPEFAEREGETVAQAGKKGAVTIATNMAGRGVDIKLGGAPGSKDLYEEVKSVGGLYIIGTERHEARRIDNQLRGRAGRQGDPGETQFYVSFEDDLMRIFANDFLKNALDRLGVEEDQPIETRIVSKQLEMAQRKIEGIHFDSRKHTLQYDDVLNQQRTKVYARRKRIVLATPDEVEVELAMFLATATDEEKIAVENRRAQFRGQALANGFAEDDSEKPFLFTARNIMLQTIDLFWVDHLEMMEYLRSSVSLRQYGQRDPLVEYKTEGLRMYKDMENAVSNEITRLLQLVSGEIAVSNNPIKTVGLRADNTLGDSDVLNSGNSAGKNVYSGESSDGANFVKSSDSHKDKVGRNDLCPCGSGKKYKKCHGQ
jgi:preprotein translocase subunit SecA